MMSTDPFMTLRVVLDLLPRMSGPLLPDQCTLVRPRLVIFNPTHHRTLFHGHRD
jgi:hypothetical protein